ncbi:MAG: Ppx/GppA family phosphatase [Firmicutes bacterium]|nr:Ppx/GppA family phosphatase [Bacillota bacterium]
MNQVNPPPPRIAVIDIGSNSIRLVMASIGNGRFFKIIYDQSVSVRLEEGMGEDGGIHPDRLERAVRTLRAFREQCDRHQPLEVIAVATEAVRRAANQSEFLARVKAETGLTVKVLSGQEEAFYDYLAVVNSLSLSDGLVMDLGGGSAELIWISDRRIRESVSLPFGSISLSQRFGLYDRVQPHVERRLFDYLCRLYQGIPWLKQASREEFVGIGGSFRNLGKIDRCLKDYPLNLTHNYRLGQHDLLQIYQMLKSQVLSERQEVKGLSEDRADIIVGAAAAVNALVEFCGAREVTVSGNGLREGLIYSRLVPGDGLVEDVLDYSLESSLFNYGIDEKHPLQVLRLALSLYRQLHPQQPLDSSREKVIKTAAMLHDCGIMVRYYRHHDHSFYLILNSEINGLSHRELVQSAHIAASHGRQSKAAMSHYQSLISKEDRAFIKRAGVILKIATCLDQSMDGVVDGVECEINHDTVLIRTASQGNAELAIRAAQETASEFKKAFKQDLLVV